MAIVSCARRRKSPTVALAGLALAALVNATPAVAVPVSLGGMGLVKTWTDNESTLNDMPDFIWGTSDADGANRIGLYARFENGLEGSVIYDGVSGLWNSFGWEIAEESATGFFTNADLLHFLFNTAATNTYPQALPIAWTDFVMDFSGNFDLDYNDQNFGSSDFRASVQGWGSVEFATYSASYGVNAVPEPATLVILTLGLVGFARGVRRRA